MPEVNEQMPDSEVQYYQQMLGAYEAEFKKWEARVRQILKRFRDDRATTTSGTSGSKFNILWSNVTTLVPACFSRVPQPDVSRRYKDNDPVGRVAALLLERALEYEVQHYPDYRESLKQVVQDRFLGGRGTAWVRYEPHIEPMDSPETDDGLQVTDDVENEGAEEDQGPQEYLDYECTPVDYVAWDDFGHEVARTWQEVNVIWRRVYMGRAALVERFPDIGEKIPLDTRPPEYKRTDTKETHQAVIYEFWNKAKNEAVWYSKGLGKIVDTRKPGEQGLPKLEGFWPCPKPLFASTTNDTLIPVPDYSLYQDQAKTLDVLATRIAELINALKIRGVHDAAAPELTRLFTEGANNNLIPVKNWAAFAEKNGLKGTLDLVDITPFAMALKECYAAMEQQKQQVYEITHVSDIMRGATDPNETLGAQQMKGQYGSLPMREMQREVEEFATSLLQIKAQIICNVYADATLLEISGAGQLSPEDQQMIPRALELLRNKPMRNFRIEVAADSMVQMDEQRERAERTEFLTAIASFLKEALPLAQGSSEVVPMLMELLKFVVSAYKVGKTMQGIIDQTADQLKKAAMQPKPQQPDPAVQKAQLDAQVKTQQGQQEMQLEQQRMAMEAQARQQEQQTQAAIEQHRNEMEAQRAALQQQHEQQLEAFKAQNEERMHQMEMSTKAQVDLILAHLQHKTQIEVAEIGAKTTLDAAQMAAANAGAESDA
jgi:hypothetical protein